MKKLFAFGLSVLLLAFTLAGCDSSASGDDTNQGDDGIVRIVRSIDELAALLASLPPNTVKISYLIVLNTSDIMGLRETLFNEPKKYVSLDLSGSKITVLRDSGPSSPTLTSITIPDSLIYENRFLNHFPNLAGINVGAANTVLSSQDGVLYNKNKTALVKYPCGNAASSFSIPDSVTSIGYRAFNLCNSLTSVKFEGTIASASFNSSAFYRLGDLRDKFYATDPAKGTPGIHTRADHSYTWALQL